MSGSTLGRFVSMAAPDALEIGSKIAINSNETNAADTPPPKTPKTKAPSFFQSLFGKQESSVSTQNPTLDETRASLDAALVKFVDEQPTPERKAAMLIKIGSYRTELGHYMPMIRDADEDMAKQVLEEWFEAGDGPLKKALVNSESGSEEFPALAKAAPDVGPEFELQKMFDALPTPREQARLAQHVGNYTAHFDNALAKMDVYKTSDADREAAIAEFINGGDGSHKQLKKAVAEILVRQRALRKAEEQDEVPAHSNAGNAASHVGSKLGATHDSRLGYTRQGSGEGAGKRMPGSTAMPNQTDGTSPTPGSGPNDGGGGEINPTLKIRRKGATGGLGSVAGSEGDGPLTEANDADSVDPATGKKRPKKKMDKGGDLAVELVKIAPLEMCKALNTLEPESRVEVMRVGAQHAADLMAWSMQAGDKLQKVALDGAITAWLQEDANTIQLKKWVAEALATAEEIPLPLAKAIMGWEPPRAAAEPAGGVRLRQRFATAA